ncbi:MAG: cell wall anchor protein [Duncaniella sp.]|uniref:cell wall anchor protein n=1 Tax=Duncaniella sp. TaxID=2518496 RepID=UPI0023D55177|nr:cell wall anchor protein [Duncaniella sp.]MDE6089233.1 cell wall anchor protein [Duncaniella sp.]
MLRPLRILLICLTALLGTSAFAQNPSVKLSLDSAFLLMGRTTPLHLELVAPENPEGHLIIPKDSMCDKVEILKLLKADTTQLGNGRIEVKQDIILQSFDSGVYRMNPIMYVVNNDTFRSNRLVLKVYPVEVDSLETIHDYADVADIDRSFIDYLPDFVVNYGLWILAVIIVLGGGAYAYYLLRNRKNPFAPVAKPVPPYEKAVDELNRLQSEKLCESGREKEFYTRLTDILRIYLQGRFGINAMEMTSTQIRNTINTNEETRLSKENMERVLETADFVKFAKVRPLPDDNIRAFNSAMQFVEDTKPKPEPAEDSAGDAADDNKNDKTQPKNHN